MPKKAKKSVRKKSAKKAKHEVKALLEGPRVLQQAVQQVNRKEVPVQDLKDVEDEIRDIINWVAVFEQEYDMPKEAVETLMNRLHEVARKVGWLHCR
jgi:hypothetical protein